jgi:predicted dehydrogenase
MSKWRALIVGCGKIAGGYNRRPDDPMVLTHALAYLRHSDYELAACAEPDEQARADFIKKWQVKAAYPTLEEALRNDRFDIVSVCSPTGTHIAALSKLSEAELKAVFAEKPLDGDAEAATKIGAVFAKREVPVAVNFTRRFDAAMKTLKSDIAAGRFGDLLSVVGWYDRGLMNNGVHLLDLMIYLTGKVTKPVALGSVRDDGPDGDFSTSALLQLGDAPFHIVAGDGRLFSQFEVEMTFANAAIRIEDSGMSMRVRPVRRSETFPDELHLESGKSVPTEFGGAMLAALSELADWKPGMRLSSDIASACESISLASEIRRQAQRCSS